MWYTRNLGWCHGSCALTIIAFIICVIVYSAKKENIAQDTCLVLDAEFDWKNVEDLGDVLTAFVRLHMEERQLNATVIEDYSNPSSDEVAKIKQKISIDNRIPCFYPGDAGSDNEIVSDLTIERKSQTKGAETAMILFGLFSGFTFVLWISCVTSAYMDHREAAWASSP